MIEVPEIGLTPILISATGILLSWWIYSRYKALNYLQSFGIPVPAPHFVFGNLRELRFAEDKNHQERHLEWLDKYGDIVGYYMGLKPRILVADLEIIKQVLVKDISIFTNRPDVPRGIPTLVSLRDQRWKEIRHILTPTFSLHKLKGMLPIMNECVDLLTDCLKEKNGQVVDVYDYYQGLTLDVISRCALALQLDCQRNQKDEILEAVRNLFRLDLSRLVIMLVCFPGLRTFFRTLFRFAPSNKFITFVVGHLKTVIENRRRDKEDPVLVDALHLLLEASEGKHEAGSVGPGQVLLNDEEIIWNAYIFLLAGYETTSTALAYTTHCLSLYPDIQEQVYEEIVDKIGLEAEITYENVNELNYMELVINETLRVYPPVPLFVSRECKETTTINGVTIPVDAVVDVPVWSIHRDPKYWPDPETFDPLRHLPEEKAKRHPMTFLPFGTGPRNCIGGRFALLEMKIALAKVLRKFVAKTCDKTVEPLPTIVRTTIMNPRDGVWVQLEARE